MGINIAIRITTLWEFNEQMFGLTIDCFDIIE